MREKLGKDELPLELSGALVFGENGHLLSELHARLAEDIAYRYRNLRLVYIPASERETAIEKNYPFGIVDIDTGKLIRRFSENGEYPNAVMYAVRWLYENDSQREDTYKRYMAEQAAVKAARDAEEKARFEEVADITAHAIMSPLHSFKHNGVKITDGYRAGQADIMKGYRDASKRNN